MIRKDKWAVVRFGRYCGNSKYPAKIKIFSCWALHGMIPGMGVANRLIKVSAQCPICKRCWSYYTSYVHLQVCNGSVAGVGSKDIIKLMIKVDRLGSVVRMAMERVWTDIPKPNPCPNPKASLCPAHESIHGHEYRSKSKSTGYSDIHGYPCVYALCAWT
jgi:hypothetical protein